MDVVELRTDLHNMIDKITDSNILKALKTLLSSKSLSQADWWETISDEERAEIEQGLKEAVKVIYYYLLSVLSFPQRSLQLFSLLFCHSYIFKAIFLQENSYLYKLNFITLSL